MKTYLILQNPGHSNVYYKQSGRLALAELKIASNRFDSRCLDTGSSLIAGIPYLSFSTDGELSETDIRVISRLSFVFAFFELVETDGKPALLPISLSLPGHVDPMISSLLKYSGKTNEIFTRMMINIALLSSDFQYDSRIALLDPVAGKGTTLFEAAVYGYDTAGVEISKRLVHESVVFFRKFLETGRYKYRINKAGGPRYNRSESFDSEEFEYAGDKEKFRDESSLRRMRFVRGDTTGVDRYFRKNSFHLIVADLPYGISHSSRQKDRQMSPSRSPMDLLRESLPQWFSVLKKGGAMVLSWNNFVMKRDEIAGLLSDNGFSVLSAEPYGDFEHKVNVSIKRDIIVARK